MQGEAMRFLALLMCLAAAIYAAEKLPEGPGLSAKHPDDAGIASDPAVLFADDFESGDFKNWDDGGKTLRIVGDKPNGGKLCVESEMVRGKNQGGEVKKWFMPGA